jgi:hypothetical protein
MNTSIHSFEIAPRQQQRSSQVIAGIAASILFCCVCSAQSLVRSPGDPPSPSTADNQSPTAAITFSDGKSVAIRAKKGRFALVAANAGESVNVRLRFPAGINQAAVVQCLDGGVLSTEKIAPDADGLGSFQFRVGSKSGLYRVLLTSADATASVLQFWVPDPDNPRSNPSALQPQ